MYRALNLNRLTEGRPRTPKPRLGGVSGCQTKEIEMSADKPKISEMEVESRKKGIKQSCDYMQRVLQDIQNFTAGYDSTSLSYHPKFLHETSFYLLRAESELEEIILLRHLTG